MSTIRLQHPLAGKRGVESAELWTFPEGLIGLPDYRRFALLPIESAAPFELLCSAEDENFGLVLVDPAPLVPDYTLSLTPADLEPLRAHDPNEIEIRVPVVLPMEGLPLSLNLKGPILLSRGARIGVQRVSPDEGHPVRFTPNLQDPASCSS